MVRRSILRKRLVKVRSWKSFNDFDILCASTSKRVYKMRAPDAVVLMTRNPFSLEKSEIYQKLEVLTRRN